MSQVLTQYTVRFNSEKEIVDVPSNAQTIVLRNEACKVFRKRNPSLYYIEYSGKSLDLVTPLSYFLVPKSLCFDLKFRDDDVVSKSTRVAIQYNSDKTSRQYSVNTTLQKIVSDMITFNDITIPSNMQPCLVYVRTPFTGSDFDYTLLDLGWIDTSLVFRFSLVEKGSPSSLPLLSKPRVLLTQSSPIDDSTSSNQIDVYSGSDLQNVFQSTSNFKLNRIREELFLMKDHLDASQYTTAVSFLSRIIQNILADPTNDTKRSLNYESNVFQTRIGSIESGIDILTQLGFELMTIDEKSKLVMKYDSFNETLLKDVSAILQNQQSTQVSIKSDNSECLKKDQVSKEAFDPTKPLVFKSLDHPSVTDNLEKRVQILQDKQQRIETQIPERNICVLRAENGFNPRNFGDSTYQNMMKETDDDINATLQSSSSYEEQEDASLIREVIQRKQQQREENQQFKTKAKRELENLQKQRVYKRTTIRVYFPDRTVIQAYFAPRETIQDVMNVIRSAIREEYAGYSFYLFNAPPKEILKPTAVLRELRMVPAAMVYLGWENGEPGVSYKEYLDEIVLQNAPMITQIDRGLLVDDDEEVKKKKKTNVFNKLAKAFKL